jgi:hypothetical protein
LISHTADEELFHLFFQLQAFIYHHSAPCFVGHLCAHTNLPGPLTQGNAITDAATQQVFVLQQAQDSHAIHHQNADALKNNLAFPGKWHARLFAPALRAHRIFLFQLLASTLEVCYLAIYGRWMLLTSLNLANCNLYMLS